MTSLLECHSSTLRGNHRNQYVRWVRRPDVKCGLSAEDRSRTVTRIIVQKWSAPAQLILEIREARAGCLSPFVVAAADRQCNPVSAWHHDGRGPDLDVERH